VHEVRHVGFAIAVISGMQIQHELRQSAVQLRQPPGQHHKPRPGNTPRGFKIHPQTLAERHVIFGLESKFSRHPKAAYLDIGALVAPIRDAGIQNIRQSQLQIRDLRLKVLEALLHALQPGAQCFPRRKQAAQVLALRLGEAHRLGIGIAFGAQLIGLDLHALALLLERGKGRHIEHKAAPRERGGNGG